MKNHEMAKLKTTPRIQDGYSDRSSGPPVFSDKDVKAMIKELEKKNEQIAELKRRNFELRELLDEARKVIKTYRLRVRSLEHDSK